MCVFHLTEHKINSYPIRRQRRDSEATVIEQQLAGPSSRRKITGHEVTLRVDFDVRRQHDKVADQGYVFELPELPVLIQLTFGIGRGNYRSPF